MIVLSNTYHDDIYIKMEDEELIFLGQNGDIEAYNFLIHRYKQFVQAKARSYFLIGADREDIVQEGMIGLFKAIRDYKKEKLSSFKAFAELCITRQIITAIKTATRQKHIPLNSYISLDKPVFEEETPRTLMDMITSSDSLDPVDFVINQEENIEVQLTDLLSSLERDVLPLFLDGRSYKEISEELNTHVKAIDNALTRIKRKLEKHIRTKEPTLMLRGHSKY
ncbi:RNA polymerase sporulation sigma factor SigH [Rossellomorea arthrocnemi]